MRITWYGDEPILYRSECCQYYALASKELYDICPLCGWEYVGNAPLDKYSGINKQTL